VWSNVLAAEARDRLRVAPFELRPTLTTPRLFHSGPTELKTTILLRASGGKSRERREGREGWEGR
jgi:hypothetical protein